MTLALEMAGVAEVDRIKSVKELPVCFQPVFDGCFRWGAAWACRLSVDDYRMLTSTATTRPGTRLFARFDCKYLPCHSSFFTCMVAGIDGACASTDNVAA